MSESRSHNMRSSNSAEIKQSVNIRLRLQNALDYAINTCVLGAANKVNDIINTNTWVLFHQERYKTYGKYYQLAKMNQLYKCDNSSTEFDHNTGKINYPKKKWHYKANAKSSIYPDFFVIARRKDVDPLMDSRFGLNANQIHMLKSAIHAINRREGNCSPRSNLCIKYLWEHSEGIQRIERFSVSTFSHVFVVVNRSRFSDSNDPSTWGNAWIIDAWYGEKGIIFPASELKKRMRDIKKYAQNQVEGARTFLKVEPFSDADEIPIKCNLEILPMHHRYPTYSKFWRIENYYDVPYAYPEDFLSGDEAKSLHKYQSAHKAVYKHVMIELITKKIQQYKNTLFSKEKKQCGIEDKLFRNQPITSNTKFNVDSASSFFSAHEEEKQFNDEPMIKFDFSSEQEALLDKVKYYYPKRFMWHQFVPEKLAVLVDVYGGNFPDVYQFNKKLFFEYSHKLVEFCQVHHCILPDTRVNNEILEAARAMQSKKNEEIYDFAAKRAKKS